MQFFVPGVKLYVVITFVITLQPCITSIALETQVWRNYSDIFCRTVKSLQREPGHISYAVLSKVDKLFHQSVNIAIRAFSILQLNILKLLPSYENKLNIYYLKLSIHHTRFRVSMSTLIRYLLWLGQIIIVVAPLSLVLYKCYSCLLVYLLTYILPNTFM